MPWSGHEIEHLRGESAEAVDSEEVADDESRSASEYQDVDGDEEMDDGEGGGEEQDEQPSPKRRRIEDEHVAGASGAQTQADANLNADVNVAATAAATATANGNDQAADQPQDGRIPFFKPGLADPDDKGENDCFFETCFTQTSNIQYLIKHLQEKHGLIKGLQGREEGGRRKTPKYLTLCPTNWPFIHGISSSCRSCGDIAGLLAVLDNRTHETPAICSFCWTYCPTRRDLVKHINDGPCKSNEGFHRKLTLIRHLFAETLRLPGAAEISRAAADERQAHAERERQARSEKWAQEAQQQQRAQEQLKAYTEARRAQQAQEQPQHNHSTPHPRLHPHLPQDLTPHANQRFSPLHGAPAPFTPGGVAAAPPPPPPGGQELPHAAVDYAVPSATVEAMARSVERLSGIIGDLTAANTQLLQEVRLRDQQIAGRDQQVRARDDRILALSSENKRLVAEVARLNERIELLEGGARHLSEGGIGNGAGEGEG
ncbi:hypothetical protein VTK56DRAFT_5551 [Thermocarpiscus australiensis]